MMKVIRRWSLIDSENQMGKIKIVIRLTKTKQNDKFEIINL